MELQDVSADEARLVDGDLVRREVKLDGNILTITKRLVLDPADGPVRDIYDVERRELVDFRDGVTRCSFCEKTNAEVAQLIAGPVSYICNECVALVADIIEDVG